jgi:hypothetical protein
MSIDSSGVAALLANRDHTPPLLRPYVNGTPSVIVPVNRDQKIGVFQHSPTGVFYFVVREISEHEDVSRLCDALSVRGYRIS